MTIFVNHAPMSPPNSPVSLRGLMSMVNDYGKHLIIFFNLKRRFLSRTRVKRTFPGVMRFFKLCQKLGPYFMTVYLKFQISPLRNNQIIAKNRSPFLVGIKYSSFGLEAKLVLAEHALGLISCRKIQPIFTPVSYTHLTLPTTSRV